ncbi:xanthine dehydrogenase family protein subunit M [Amycolatopsis sp. SID8362]|uniref:FAD binding domain-containing protein n=1 Tax=Amycolatopsis sp. SID8362 TaxID=2690346 RepID=UPI00136F24FB|nr:xanthine dehydrogenase family protein subunit M [Amycolatopsis sp. SID8362]NBH05636.1 xanthine dehydrogenase family protein subunit M [Amycolatopsis sp. SID8362]NED42335.1 xanthine dehydrogenase family protein subunit M [Amycolatopsis sp. SID8362]
MKAAAFEYVRAESVADAISSLAAEGAQVLAGGQSLVPLLNMRLARPSLLVDVNGLEELSYIRRDGEHVEIGALTRQRAVETSDVVRRDVPLLAQALRHVGHVATRNRGTLGGSLAHADPAAELPAVAVALDAELLVRGPQGERVVGARKFFESPFRTVLAPGELLTAVRFPVRQAACAIEELSRRSKDLALVAVFVTLEQEDGRCARARIAVAGAGPTPIRAVAAEELLHGRSLDDAVIAEAAQEIAAATDPPSDLHAPADYRREMAAVLGRRALTKAVR